ncbi:long-chain-fatty-acid--CoA ligase ACSBG2-like [Lissotriton helveticus]
MKQTCKTLDIVDQQVLITYLPLSHAAAQLQDLWLPIFCGGTTYFADPDALKGSLITTLREVRPTAFLGVPRVWEQIQERMKDLGAKSSLIQRKVAAWAKSVGLQARYNRMNGISSMPWGYTLANILVFRRVHAALGLDRCTWCYSGTAPIMRDTLEFFMSLNLPVMEMYGMSESTGPHTIAVSRAFRIMSTGKEMPGCRTQIYRPEEDGTGEVCFWGRHVFMGYLNMAEKTKEALDEEGWLHSGDLGKHDQDGYLFITGRIKELIITAGGENIPPFPIEDAIKEEIPIISNAMLIGDKMKFLSMLLTLKCKVDADTGEPKDELTSEAVVFCQQLRSSATRVSEIVSSRDPAIYTAIQEGVDRVNRRATSNAQRVQKWSILCKDFSMFGGELEPVPTAFFRQRSEREMEEEREQPGLLGHRRASRQPHPQQIIITRNECATSLITNLSDTELTQMETKVLEKGLGFVPTARPDKFRLHCELTDFFRKLKLKAFFEGKDDPNSDNRNGDTGLRLKSSFTPPPYTIPAAIIAFE